VIERCTISGKFVAGISVYGLTQSELIVRNTEIVGVGRGIDVGGPGGESIRLAVYDSSITRTDDAALDLHANMDATIANTQLIGSGIAGVNVTGGPGYAVKAHVTKSVIRGFGVGARANDTAPPASRLSIADTDFSLNSGAGVQTVGAATIALTGNRFFQ